MLAVQHRPQAMASGRHSDAEPAGLFGYSFEEFPLEDAPEPAPGAPLLSDNEQRFLNTWFEEMSSDDRGGAHLSVDIVHSENWNDFPPQFVGSATSFGFVHDTRHGLLSDHAFDTNFITGLPYMPLPEGLPASQTNIRPSGVAFPSSSSAKSSPALPAPPASTSGSRHFSLAPAAHSSMNQLPDDVVAAASLLQNGHLGARRSSFHYSSRANLGQEHRGLGNLGLIPDPVSPIPEPAMLPSGLIPPGSHNGISLHADGRPISAARVNLAATHLGNSLETLESSRGTVALRHVSLPSLGAASHPLQQGLQWGTDTNFTSRQFEPPSEKETSEHLMNEHLRSMEWLKVNQSANTTRPSTPTFETALASGGLQTHTTSSAGDAEAASRSEVAPPRKRRKGKGALSDDAEQMNEDSFALSTDGAGDGEDTETPSSGTGVLANGKARKRKAKPTSHGHALSNSSASPTSQLLVAAESSPGDGASVDGTASGPAAAKRRRSSAVPKAPRENLTDEQKRENHIKSEQKRRSLIKSGFDDLCQLVPGLQGGSLSKSVMLTMAGDWLEDLLRGNKRLEEQLRRM